MREITAKAGQELFIGKRGENKAVCVVFDISDWITLYGAGSVQLIHQRNGDKIPYPCAVEVSGGTALWSITKTDVGNPGVGRAELQYWVGDSIVKSEIFSTKTARAMGDAGETPPAPATTWLEQMQQLGVDTEDNAQAAEASANAAAASAASVKTSEENAAASARSAAASEASVAANAQSAKASAESAANSAAAAEASAKNAADNTAAAVEQKLAGHVEAAETAEAGAKAAQKAAEDARDAASEIVGGDFASKTEAQGYANAAESNAKSYTDQKIAAIPTPDVSGQINTHNSSTTAHSDIRQAVSNAASAASAAATAAANAQTTANGKEAAGTAASAVSAHNTSASAHSDIRTAVSNAATAASNAASAAATAQSTANAKASTATYSVSVDTSWSANSAGGFYKTVTVSGMLATDNPIADIILGADVDANALYIEAWSRVTRITTAANSITLYANGDAPETAFTIQLKAVR